MATRFRQSLHIRRFQRTIGAAQPSNACRTRERAAQTLPGRNRIHPGNRFICRKATRKIRLLDRSFQGNGTARESARRRRNDIPVCRRRRRMDADRQQDRKKHPRTVRSVQTNRRRRGSGPIRRIEVYRTAGRLRAGGLQLRQSKKLPGSQAYCKFSFNKTVKISISSHKKQDGIVLR